MSTRRTRLGVESLEVRDVPAMMVSVAAIDAVGSETGPDRLTFAVTRSGDGLDQPTAVNLAWGGTANSNDVKGATQWVNFAAGQTVAHVHLKPIDDARAEGRETVELRAVDQQWYDVGGGPALAAISDNDARALPVLMVIANRDFYYQEYADTRRGLEENGLRVRVAAATRTLSHPHPNSGQGPDGGLVMPDVAITAADASNYSAIVFVGGWGSSSYQYAFAGTYNNAAYNGAVSVEQATNELINDFVMQDKYVTAICHGVSVLAWARVDGVSPIAGRTVSAYGLSAPAFAGATPDQLTTRWHVESNGATMVASGSVGNPFTAADDVIVDGKIITAENFDSALAFGRTIADQLLR
jgi:putative intracellular protease/amidase